MAVTGDAFAITCYLVLMAREGGRFALNKTATELTDDFDLCDDGAAGYARLERSDQLLVKTWATTQGVSLPAEVTALEADIATAAGVRDAALASAESTYTTTVEGLLSDYEIANP